MSDPRTPGGSGPVPQPPVTDSVDDDDSELTPVRQELLRRIDDRHAKISFLQEVTQILSRAASLQEIFEQITQKAQELLPYEICSAHLVDYNTRRVSVVLAHAPVEARWNGRAISIGEGIVGRVAETGMLINAHDVQRDDRWIESVAGIGSELALPILADNHVVAVLNLESSRADTFTPYDEQIFSILATQIGQALERMKLARLTEQRTSRLQALNRLAREMAGEPDLERIFRVVAGELSGIVQSDRVSLALYDPNEDELEVVGVTGMGNEDVGVGFRYSILDAVAQAEGPLVRWEMGNSIARQRLAKSGIRLTTTVPIRLDDAFVAELNIGFTDEARLPDGQQIEFLWSLAAHLAVVLKSARMYRELRTSGEELASTQNKLLQTAKLSAVGELAAGVAHELNNPLTGILGYTQYCLMAVRKSVETESNPELLQGLEERMKKIEAEVLRCKEIVQNLLNFSRAHDRRSFERISMNDVVNATLGVLEHQLTRNQISVSLDLATDVPAVRGNANQLQQVFTNIVINAQKAMIDGGSLQIRTGYSDTNDTVYASFADSGPGIPASVIERIFDPFFTTRKVGEGTGLGLSVSYGLVTDHGGKISVVSEENEGATFTVELPALTITD